MMGSIAAGLLGITLVASGLSQLYLLLALRTVKDRPEKADSWLRLGEAWILLFLLLSVA